MRRLMRAAGIPAVVLGLLFGTAANAVAADRLPLQVSLSSSKTQLKPDQYVTVDMLVNNPTNRRVGRNMRLGLRFSTGRLVSYDPFAPQIVSVQSRTVYWQLQGSFPRRTAARYSITVAIGKGNRSRVLCVTPQLKSQDGKRVRLPQALCLPIRQPIR